ncbi:MAG: secretin N-terminal domain-containing protein [Pirellulales bacterium]
MAKRTHHGRWNYLAITVTALAILAVGITRAQEAPVVVAPAGQPMTPEMMKAMAEQAGRRGGRPGPQPPQEAKPDDKDKKKEGEGDDKKKDDAGDSVKRPEKPPRIPDPREFEVALDDKGRVPPFNFIGQPWPDVLQWLANISKSSLDWQELPNDYLNLTTQRSYTLDELHDVINRHLHARGYTSIQAGEVLSVFKIDKLDPSLVRRVDEDQLYDLKAYDYVKVSFELPDGMEVDKAKDDVKQLLSPSAKVFPLVTTRRLLLMDAVENLRTVSELLNQERMVQDGRIIPNEFVLKYARPQQVIETLYVLLGVDPKAKPAQTDPNVQRQQMEMMQQMQQRGQDVSKMMPQKEGPKVYLAFNRQRNSVLANAPPEEMKKIERAIRLMDVPYGGGEAASAAGVSDTAPGASQRTMKKYQLTTLDPNNFVLTLSEIGGLSPFAEFKVDEKSKTLFALATDAEHEKINGLIDQFDGTGRQFEVIWLRRLPADAVAATIFNLMAGQTEEEEDDDRGRYWNFWDRDREEDKEKPVKGFGVDADIENNRLLIWANDAEMERVRDLLVKLGEIPSGQQDPRPVRFVQPADGKVTPELLEQLRQAWSAAGGSELIIKVPPQAKPDTSEEKKKKDAAETKQTAQPAEDRSTGVHRSLRVAARYVQLAAESSSGANENAAAKPGEAAEPATPPTDTAEPAAPQEEVTAQAPVTITVTEDGQLMLSSPDTAALDRLEELIAQLSPAERRFHVYPLKHVRASEMYYVLTDYFKEDLAEEDETSYDFFWYPPRRSGGKDKGATGLGTRRKLMITWETASNSILVSNASPSQSAEIEQLIEVFDRPARSDSVEHRQTAAIKVHYSRPSVIATAVKEVYRDLLSSRDKEFDRGDQRGEQRTTAERVTILNYGSSSSDDDRQSPVKVGFDGALSLGADDISGILIVSAQKGIFNDIVRMVKELDAEAAPQTTVHVHRVTGNVTAAALQKAIDEALSKPWLGNRPEQTGTSAQTDQSRDGDRDRDRDRGRRRDRDNDND